MSRVGGRGRLRRGIGVAPPMALGRLARWLLAATEGFGEAALGAKDVFLSSFFLLALSPQPSTLY